MKKLTKTQVIAKIKKEGSFEGYMNPSKMRPNLNGNFSMMCPVEWSKEDLQPLYPDSKEIPNLNKVQSDINSFSYYNCTNETGNRVHFYTRD